MLKLLFAVLINLIPLMTYFITTFHLMELIVLLMLINLTPLMIYLITTSHLMEMSVLTKLNFSHVTHLIQLGFSY